MAASDDREHAPRVPVASLPGAKLSKSRYLAGRQCAKRLWLGVHARELATPPGAAQQALFDAGSEIGRHAHELFPGGVLVEESHQRHAAACGRTRALMGDDRVPALFEAAFEHAGVRIRADVLERLGGGSWGLREVKSGASVKPVNLEDLALQRFVLEGCGVRVPSAELIHVNRDYVRGEGPVDWRRFFARADLTREVEERARDVAARVRSLHGVLGLPEAPGIEASPHCSTPHPCEFWEHCSAGKPADWIYRLPRLQGASFAALRRSGVERIPEIPDAWELTPLQARVREVLRSGLPYVGPELARELGSLQPPLAYLDFEAVNPAIPAYPGTRPYQALAFQWSLHRLNARGDLVQRGFLADGRGDPRRPLAEALLAALADCPGPILVYSHYEAVVLSELESGLPDLAAPLAEVRARLVDLAALVRRQVYHPGFRGSFSLKDVVPALVPDFDWSDLETVQGGEAAQLAYGRLMQRGIPAEQAGRLRAALEAYCERDTLALVELHGALERLARA